MEMVKFPGDQAVSIMHIDFSFRTHTGLVRPINEDSLLVLPELGVFLVADGMGGEAAGEEASAQVVASVSNWMLDNLTQPPRDPDQLEQVMLEALREANLDVFRMSQLDPDKQGMGSTASLLCLHRDGWFVGQIGDSRVYLVRHGLLKQLTSDQTVAWELLRQGLIDRHQLNEHPSRHLLTQCIGNGEPLHVELSEGLLQVGDLFLLCSDGLTGYIEEPDLFEMLTRPAPDLNALADQLVAAALAGGGGDNISLILLRPRPDPGGCWYSLHRGHQDLDVTQKGGPTHYGQQTDRAGAT